MPEVETPSVFLNADDQPTMPGLEAWKTIFHSPELDLLLARAEAGNHNLLAAWQSVVASRAIIQRFRADGLPSADAGLSGNFFQNSDDLAGNGSGISGQRLDADISVDWELDLFGKIRRSVEAAVASSELQEAFYQDLMFTIQADVASHYFQINSLQEEIELLGRSRETRQESLELIRQRLRAGTVSELAVAQTTTLLANAEARLYNAMRVQNSLVYSLAALLGETPSTFRFKPAVLKEQPPFVPSGLPGDLLTRRPDIRAAERALAIANAEIGIAQASFFPSISLRGTIGYATTDWDRLFESSAYTDGLRSGIRVPIFRGGSLKADKERALAVYEQSLEIYKQIVIEAVAETEDLLQSVQLLSAQSEALERSVIASKQAREISMLQYRQGLSDFISALDAERTALNEEQLLVQVKRSQYITTINLIRALGGSW